MSYATSVPTTTTHLELALVARKAKLKRLTAEQVALVGRVERVEQELEYQTRLLKQELQMLETLKQSTSPLQVL
jgi:hypothetical protein